MISRRRAISDIEILVVEDSPTQAIQLQHILEKHGYRISVANNGKQALVLMSENKPDIVISDVMMPEMDGYDFCWQIKAKEEFKDIPVILLTSLSDPEDIIKGLECGADNFIMKPYEEKNLISRIQYIISNWRPCEQDKVGVEVSYGGQKYCIFLGHQQIIDNLLFTYEITARKNQELVKVQNELRLLNVRLEEKVRERTAALTAEVAERERTGEELRLSLERLQRTFEGTVNALASIAEKRDPYTAGHQQRVAELACAIAKEMHLPGEQVEGIRVAGIVHDIGKVSVPAEMLSKPSQLSEMEFNIIKSHPQHGYDILRTIEFPWPIAQIVLQHHERMDGSGYPSGLYGESILLESRILAVADVVDAMASHRPYRPSCGIKKAMEEISKNSGILYDSEVAGACLKLLTEKGFKCA